MTFNYKRKKIVFKHNHMGFLILDTIICILIGGQSMVPYPLNQDLVVQILMLTDLIIHTHTTSNGNSNIESKVDILDPDCSHITFE